MRHGLGRIIGNHLWAWAAASFVLMAFALILRARIGAGHHLGDLAALCGMLAGALIMIRVDKGRLAEAVDITDQDG